MKLFDFQPEGAANCSVSAYLQTETKGTASVPRPAVVICPGGGYDHLSVREGEPVVREYFTAGYQMFLLHYSVEEGAKNLQPLMQLAAAVAHIRRNAKEWNVDREKVAVCGFSAGGHLAASLGTLYDDAAFLERWKRTDAIRPDAMLLCYPVITADEFAHVRSLKKVSGAEVGSAEYSYFGLDRHVDCDTHLPPFYGTLRRIAMCRWRTACAWRRRCLRQRFRLNCMFFRRGSMACRSAQEKWICMIRITAAGWSGASAG